MTRRAAMKAGTTSALGGALAMTGSTSTGSTSSGGIPSETSVYEKLGVKTVINAAGTLTTLGGSLMPPEVLAALTSAAQHFVEIGELQDRIGERIAALIGVDAALVTTGAAGAMLLATAAAVTRGDAQRIARLPDTTGMKSEVITQKSHHTCYDHQITNCGVKLIDVETRQELDRAINEQTALMLFYNLLEPDGKIKKEEWIEVARRHGVPTLVDAAADVPPVDALSLYNNLGFDMVAFSGGKALSGPSNTGLLLGKKEFIEAAKLNTNPHCGTIGRMLKVSKEDMVALWAAVERYVRFDHQAERREWERRLAEIEKSLGGIPTITTQRFVPPIANHVPHLLVFWDESRVRIARDRVTKQMAEGNPSIALGRVSGTGDRGLLISVFQLKSGEEQVVARRLCEILQAAAS
ncbi:MAG TPA: aminotransferase class V-fold PLP-dependent enzyme [Planctomycetaceae bacterium]|jgi:L-seryl-tRNA(Ser) seleniumtransferase|nr:aminotransferase class V-fold PLP-dependent enzyme [Planctomycetaceae bacterium]